MFDLTQFLISSAHAQTAADPAATAGAGSSMMMSYLPLLLIFAVFYVLIIRPQQKKLDEQTKMIKALRRGDRVVTSSGIYGKISKLDGDDQVTLEIADGVQVKFVRSQISALAAKTDPVSPAVTDGDDEEKKN